jgi:hypothetical protein
MIRDSKYRLDRRDFVRTLSASLAALPLLDARGLAQALAPRRSRVALVRTSDRKRGVTEILKLLNPQGLAGKRIVLKPNFNSADDAPGSTHNDTLTQIVAELHARGARSITLGESSGPGVTRDVMEKKGIFDLGRDLRFDIVDYDQNTDKDWVSFPAAGTHWPNGFSLPRLVVDSEYTHAQADTADCTPVAGRPAHDCGAEHGLQAEPDCDGRRRCVHGRRTGKG